MAICGFNQKMLDGITALMDGAIEYGIIERSKKNGVSTDEQFVREAREIASFIYNSKSLNDSGTQKQIEGIALLVGGTFQKDVQRGIADYALAHQSDARLLKDLDDHFYQALRGDINNMPRLFEWVNEHMHNYR